METILISSAILLFAVLGFLLLIRKSNWYVLNEDKDINEEISNQFAYLKQEGIRCKLKQEPVPFGNQNSGLISNSMENPSDQQKVQLLVYKDDFVVADELLHQADQHSGFHL